LLGLAVVPSAAVVTSYMKVQPSRGSEPGLVERGMMHRPPDRNEHEVVVEAVEVVAAVAVAAVAGSDSFLFNSVSEC
jgi:hypothetical protein